MIDNSKGYFVWVERAPRRWQPKQNRLRRVTAFFCCEKVGLMSSGAASLVDASKILAV